MENFCEVIKLNERILPEEVVSILVKYHQSTKYEILKGFFNLGKHLGITSTIEFRQGLNNGNPCIVMAGLDEESNQVWYSLLDKYTGQSQNFCS